MVRTLMNETTLAKRELTRLIGLLTTHKDLIKDNGLDLEEVIKKITHIRYKVL